MASLASCSALGFVGIGQPVRRARPRRRESTSRCRCSSRRRRRRRSPARWRRRRTAGGCPRRPARDRRPSPACSASHAPTVPGSSAPPRTSKPSSTSGSTAASVSNSRSRSTRNSRSSNSRWIWSRSHGCIRSVSGVCASGTSLTSSVRSRLRIDAGQVRPQRVADLAAHRVDVVDERLQRAVLGDPLGRGLLPHARECPAGCRWGRRAARRSPGTAGVSARTFRRRRPG